MSDYDVAIVGAGHNGLTCACYLARAGLRVIVLEMADRIGGATHTAATIPGMPTYRFDTCSVVHNMINMTTVVDELRLGDVGLEYVETDPFVTTFLAGGGQMRFYRSVERTCQEIARVAPHDADTYRRFIAAADPIVDLGLAAFRSSGEDGGEFAEWTRRTGSLARTLRHWSPRRLAATLLGTYGTVLDETFRADHVRAGIAALAAHGTLGPDTPGAAFFVLWQAAYHRYGNWHARGGSGALAAALERRLTDWGGEVRVGARVTRIVCDGELSGVQLDGGEKIAAGRIVTAINPQTALLDLVGETRLPIGMARRLRARHRSNVVQFVVHAALDRLPAWPDAPGDVWNGMQSIGTSLDQFRANFHQAEAGLPPSDPAVYVYTPSAIDASIAPPGGHGAYIACAAYPARFADGTSWSANGEREAHRLVDAVDARAPGFAASIRGLAWRDASQWEREIGLVGGHPMHLDLTMDQLGPLRPLPELADHRGPLPGLYISGAGTAPTGGVSAVPGRATARALLADMGRR